MVESLLSARGLKKVFGAGETFVEPVKGVDLDVQAGEFLVIMGPSGSGKSTLLHLLGGIEPPTAGEVLLDGRSLTSSSPREHAELRRRRIGFVFQKFNLLPHLSAVQNVALPLILDGVPQTEALSRARAALESAGIAHRAENRAGGLSGGEQQRVAIARALVIDPVLILADEPTGALDSQNGLHVAALLQRLAHERKRAIVLVTHDPQFEALADRCLHYRDGGFQAKAAAH